MLFKKQKINWINPLNLAQKIADNYGDESWIFLNSGLCNEIKNSRSIIALFLQEEIILDNFLELKKISTHNKYFGYISYEALQSLPKTQKSFIDLPKIFLLNFALIFEFNHDKKIVEAYFYNKKHLDEVLNYQIKSPLKNKVKVTNLASNFSDDQYIGAVEDIKEMISCGDFYQANLTRKFFGNINFDNQRDFFKLFAELDKTSPANYSSFLKLRDNFIISSSPELFLSIKNNRVISRPIKGTAARSPNNKRDQLSKIKLQNNPKERAENLMIVDLVRNDLSRFCKAGSVVVKNLFKVNSYKTLHHMSSEIIGRIADGFSVIDCIESCFPAGSMTGAPKIKATEIIAQKEKLSRGVYSGAIGYFSEKEANFSVVIRTLVCQKNKFEFQVGGAITFDSNALAELEETKIKAKAIKKVLKIK